MHVVENQSTAGINCMAMCLYVLESALKYVVQLYHWQNFASELYLISALIEFRRKFDEISIDQYLIDAHDSTTID